MNLIKSLCYLGTQNISDAESRNRVIAVNAIASLTAVFAFVLGLTFYYVTGNTKILYPALLEGLSFLLVLPLNYLGLNKWTPVHAQLTHNFAMVYFGILLSQAVDATLLVFFLCAHAYFFFSNEEKQQTPTMVLCMILAGVSLFAMETIKQLNLVEVLSFNTQQYYVVHFCGSAVIIILTVVILIQYRLTTRALAKEKMNLLIKVKEQNEQLEIRIKERTNELQVANNSILVYLREISHEIRAPLSSILVAAQLSQEKQTGDKLNNIILSRCHSALRIINNILTFDKISKGERQKIDAQAFAFRPFITNIVNASQMIAYEQSVHIQLLTPVQLLPEVIISDQTMLEKILNNLLTNAIKFTPKHTEVRFSVDVQNNSLHLSVSDQGSGIPHGLLPNLFQPFHPAHQKFIQGNGIGLNLVHRLVDLLKGTIEIKTSDQGTTFDLEIPITTSDLGSFAKEAFLSLEQDFAGTKLLVIEDDRMAQYVAEKILTQAGCEIAVAENFSEGLQAIAIHPPEIIVLDFTMPGISGFDAIDTLKNDPITANIPIIIMSANAFEEDIASAYKMGASAYIVKPVNKIDFLNAVAKCKKIISTNKVLNDMI